jgi:hypothetical protein
VRGGRSARWNKTSKTQRKTYQARSEGERADMLVISSPLSSTATRVPRGDSHQRLSDFATACPQRPRHYPHRFARINSIVATRPTFTKSIHPSTPCALAAHLTSPWHPQRNAKCQTLHATTLRPPASPLPSSSQLS